MEVDYLSSGKKTGFPSINLHAEKAMRRFLSRADG